MTCNIFICNSLYIIEVNVGATSSKFMCYDGKVEHLQDKRCLIRCVEILICSTCHFRSRECVRVIVGPLQIVSSCCQIAMTSLYLLKQICEIVNGKYRCEGRCIK